VPSALDIDRAVKAQWVRAADVVLIGPLMVWGGVALGRRRRFAGALLVALGIGTVFYNGRNYLIVQRAINEARGIE